MRPKRQGVIINKTQEHEPKRWAGGGLISDEAMSHYTYIFTCKEEIKMLQGNGKGRLHDVRGHVITNKNQGPVFELRATSHKSYGL